MFYLEGNRIYLTKGDTAYLTIALTNPDGSDYTPVTGDTIRFAMKALFTDAECAINKQFDMTNLQLTFLPADTKELLAGKEYVYDIELTDSEGRVTTVISDKLKLMEEVE